MKVEITETPKITYNKIIYVFKAKVEGKEYKIGRHEVLIPSPFLDNRPELYVTPHPKSDKVYDAIEKLFLQDDFDYNTTQAGEILTIVD